MCSCTHVRGEHAPPCPLVKKQPGYELGWAQRHPPINPICSKHVFEPFAHVELRIYAGHDAHHHPWLWELDAPTPHNVVGHEGARGQAGQHG